MIKKLLVIIFVLILAGTAYARDIKSPQYLMEEETKLQSIAKEIGPSNFQGLHRWLETNLRYKEDRDWKEPLEIIQCGKGDCKNYGTLTLAILKHMGVKDAFLLGVCAKNRNLGHVVCFFRENKDQAWRYYSFEKLENGPKSFKDLPYVVARECRYGSRIMYQLANEDMKNIPPEEEKNYGLTD